MYKFIAYGQKIESDSMFDQFIPADFEDEPDLVIHHYVEKEIKDALTELYMVTMNGRDISYRNQVGYFEARAGKEIFYEEYPGQDEAEAKEFVMGNTIALLFFERDMNVIHGSAVRFNDRTIIISGDSGAGKSTTASKLIKEGGKLISDDQCVVFMQDGQAMLLPGYPSQKLCEDASERNEFDVNKLIKIDNYKNKFAIPRVEDYFGKISKLDAIYFLSKHQEGNDVIFENIKGADKVNIMTMNLFLKPFFRTNIGLPPQSMLQCVNIASLVEMYSISRKNGSNTEEEIFNYISDSFH
jgi:hypothetical protein